MEDLVICNKSDLTAIANAIRDTSNSSQTYNVPLLITFRYVVVSKLRRA